MEVTFRNGKTETEKEEKAASRFLVFHKASDFSDGTDSRGLCFYYFGGYADKVAKLHSEAVELVQKSDKNTFYRRGRVHSTTQTVMRYPRQPLPKRLTM